MASETSPERPVVSRGRQWFALWGAPVAWLVLFFANIVITWQACLHHEQLGGASSHAGLLILNMVIFFVLLATAVLAGVLAYRAWRKRTRSGAFFSAEAEDRHEYMAMIGVLMTIAMGVGIIWLGIPLWIISLCVRTR